jgi:hypothetical protein
MGKIAVKIFLKSINSSLCGRTIENFVVTHFSTWAGVNKTTKKYQCGS